MRDALKKHILRERQRKKEEADANEADKQRRREEKVFKFLFYLLKQRIFMLRFILGKEIIVIKSSIRR
jgi:hypothetical protein